MSLISRSKFRCTEIQACTVNGDPARSTTFKPVSPDGSWPLVGGGIPMDPAPENAIFGHFTPSGQLEQTILDSAGIAYKLGAVYYLDITSA